MDKIPFQDGTKITNAYVTVEGEDLPVVPAQYSGSTPFSAFNLNKMQDNIETAISTLDGRIAVLEGTLVSKSSSTTASKSISLPTGFNADNCVVISCAVYWGQSPYDVYYGVIPQNIEKILVSMSDYSNNINIQGRDLDSSGYYTYKYRVVLLKIHDNSN